MPPRRRARCICWDILRSRLRPAEPRSSVQRDLATFEVGETFLPQTDGAYMLVVKTAPPENNSLADNQPLPVPNLQLHINDSPASVGTEHCSRSILHTYDIRMAVLKTVFKTS